MEFQQSINVYPGDAKCRAEQPHSIWHEQSGNGLVDLALVANYADQIFRNPTEDGMTIDGVCFSLLLAPIVVLHTRSRFPSEVSMFRS
jgi:hypothetical protein